MKVVKGMAVVYKIMKWLFPKTCYTLQQEVRDFYISLGVKVTYTIPPLQFPTVHLQEGIIPQNPQLRMIAKATVDENREVQVW